jgi:hypothetical protein
MAAFIRFDVNRRAKVVETLDGLVVNRQCLVSGLAIAGGTSDPEVLLKARAVSGFPALLSAISATYPQVLLRKRSIFSIDQFVDTVDVDLEYTGPLGDPPSGGGIFFTLDQAPSTEGVDWYMTADGSSNLKVWYMPGSSATGAAPAGSIELTTKTHKLRCPEVINASGPATFAQWSAVSSAIRAAGGTINSDTWGGYARGTWLCLPPHTRNLDSSGLSLMLTLTFLRRIPDWFAVEVHRDLSGRIPKDIVSEATLRGTGLPAVNAQKQANGITIASVYGETAFTPLFGFTPA